MNEHIEQIDEEIIEKAQMTAIPLARFALFVVYFWFGLLKVLALSPATPLVLALFNKTLNGFIGFNTFNILFGVFEMLIGLLFLFPRLIRVALPLLVIHLITTALPLIVLPNLVWTHFFVPTLEGQYIIKNLLIIACAIIIVSETKPLKVK